MFIFQSKGFQNSGLPKSFNTFSMSPEIFGETGFLDVVAVSRLLDISDDFIDIISQLLSREQVCSDWQSCIALMLSLALIVSSGDSNKFSLLEDGFVSSELAFDAVHIKRLNLTAFMGSPHLLFLVSSKYDNKTVFFTVVPKRHFATSSFSLNSGMPPY